MTDTLDTQIRSAEEQRCAAMLANDGAALDALLDPRLQFHHATGAVDGKEAYLAKMAAGRILYVGIAWDEERVTELGPDAAMLTRPHDDRREGGRRRQAAEQPGHHGMGAKRGPLATARLPVDAAGRLSRA